MTSITFTFQKYDRVEIPLHLQSPSQTYGVVIGYLWSDKRKVEVWTSRGLALLQAETLNHYEPSPLEKAIDEAERDLEQMREANDQA